MARNSLLPVWDKYVEDLTEAKEPRLWSSLPAAATESYIQDTRLSWTPLLHAPQGVRRSSTTSPRVWRGCHRGGLLAIGIARFTVTPFITGGRHTHTPSIPLLLKDPSSNYLSMLEVITKSEVGQSEVWLLNTLLEDLWDGDSDKIYWTCLNRNYILYELCSVVIA